jgi:iron-sulfur cluster repair protein YtfE (RIC family)
VDIIEHLTQEHRKAEELLERLGASDSGSERSALIDQLEEALAIHMAVEEEFLYPIVESTIGGEEATEANAEHGLARQGLSILRDMQAEPGFGAAVDMLKGGIGHHVQEEEEELFPRLRAAAGDQLAGLDPVKLEKVAGATREQLYEAARAQGIEGRSRMTKSELADAITGAGQ